MESTKKFQVEELENRLEMAAIEGVGTGSGEVPADENKSCNDNGCVTNDGCTSDAW